MILRRVGALLTVAIAAGLVFPQSNAFAADPAASASASATPLSESDEQAKASLQIHAATMFGSDVAIGSGWGEVVASLENVSGSVRRGTITLRGSMPWGGSGPSVTTNAPFSVAPGRTAIVKLPTHGLAYASPTYTVDVVSDSGVLLSSITLPSGQLEVPLIVDVDEPSRLAVAMRNWPLSLDWIPAGAPGFSYGTAARTTTLAVGSPRYDRATGDPILPDHPADYSSATMVLIHSDALARLDAAALQALADWVISGGTLAIIPARADDLRGGTLSAFIGGAAVTIPPPPAMLTLPTTLRPASAGTFPTPPVDDDSPSPLKYEAPPSQPSGQNANPFLPIVDMSTNAAKSPYIFARAATGGHGPSPAVRAVLAGYSGGNLTPSVFGSSAAYGSGEVHLLAFDPTVAPLVDDPWIQSRVVDLVSHAWDRRAINAIILGSGQTNMGDVEAIRRALDPNENFRPALAIAALLLIIYSIVSGPVIFMQATKRARPLAPLKWAPIASAVMFATLVIVGLAGKGWRGRARHVAFVEAGAGVSRGAVRRYRGFFTSDTRKLTVAASSTESVLNITSSDSTDKSELAVDRSGLTIQNVVSLPWQTIVAREESVIDLKAGVSVLTNPDGSIDVVNHTGRELDDVLAYAPKDGIHYFASIKDGVRTNSAAGLMLITAASRPLSSASSMVVHSLDTSMLGVSLDAKTRARITETWSPIGSAVGQSVDWFPDDVPIVLAEVKGGEGVKRDSGLAVESDRMLIRIVGRGGAP